MTGFIEELESTIAGVAARVGPAVVGLGRGWGRGSGVVIGEGRVLTNAHVLRGEEVAVRRSDGEVALGRVAARDDTLVVAVDTGPAPAVAWEPDAVGQLRTGQAVFALADPGGRGLRTTFGLVTATGRSFRGPRRRTAARDQLRADGGRPAARAPGGRGAARRRRGARARRGAGPAAARPGARAAAGRAPHARRRRAP